MFTPLEPWHSAHFDLTDEKVGGALATHIAHIRQQISLPLRLRSTCRTLGQVDEVVVYDAAVAKTHTHVSSSAGLAHQHEHV